MRIGELASKFNISQSTIRYYISKGILIPTRKNSQYVFSQSDIKELEIILKLKKLFCSIDEIQEYLQILRLYNPQDAIEKKHLSLFLEKKYENLKTEIINKKNALKQIETLLSQFNFTDLGNYPALSQNYSSFISGVPLEFAVNLSCPVCETPFFLQDISIRENKIIGGKLECSCGYKAIIEDGIILTPEKNSYYTSNDFYIMHYREIPPKDSDFVFFEYMKDLSPEVINLMHSAYKYIDTILSSYDFNRKVIFVPDLASHFLYKFIKKPYFENAYIITCGFSKQNILSMKSHIDAIAPRAKILYIANTVHELPVRKNFLDLWIDSISSYNFAFFHPFSLHEKIYPYMKPGAFITGLTKYYKNNAKSISNIRNGYPNCIRNHGLLSTFEMTLSSLNYKLDFNELIGKTANPGPYYEYHAKGEEHYYTVYGAKK